MNLRKMIHKQNDLQTFELQLREFFNKNKIKPLDKGPVCQKES